MRCSHILLDFFGTIVDYVPGGAARVDQSCALLRSFGIDVPDAEFITRLEAIFTRYEDRSAIDDTEYSMHQVCAELLAELQAGPPECRQVDALVQTYLSEWNRGVCYPEGMPDTIRALASRYRLAVVTNTHHPQLVPDHLAAMGVTEYIDVVVTSVELGRRKPHPAIYAEALRRVEADASDVIFVGDTFIADFSGPQEAGMTAFLIDPLSRHRVPDARRLRTLSDLEARLREL